MLYLSITCLLSYYFFFFNDTATTEIYTLSLHDALPISRQVEHLAFGREHVDPVREQLGTHALDQVAVRLGAARGAVVRLQQAPHPFDLALVLRIARPTLLVGPVRRQDRKSVV